MPHKGADVVVCGAGIAGVAVAHRLAVREGIKRVILCDPRPPLTLTSDKSTECYRNLWPNQPMVSMMNRTIDLIEELSLESGDSIGLNRRGYLYVTADPERLAELEAAARLGESLGTGPLRVHGANGDYVPAAAEGWHTELTGTDVIGDASLLHSHFEGLSDNVVGALHVRRAGWLSAQQLGAFMLDRARDAGLELVQQAVTSVSTTAGRVTGVTLDDGRVIGCDAFVNAAGPMLGRVGRMHGEDIPVHSEVHLKVAFRDHLEVIPRAAPLMIWADPQQVGWSEEERAHLRNEGRSDLLEQLPEACHGRPEGAEGSNWVLALWEYRRNVIEPEWPIPQDPLYGEVVLRGMAAMYPGMDAYADRMPQRVVDGGYYTKTVENRPLAGPLQTDGAYVAGALSGFGVMAACGVAEMTAAHIAGSPLPDYAPAFQLSRYEDPAYRTELETLESGQL